MSRNQLNNRNGRVRLGFEFLEGRVLMAADVGVDLEVGAEETTAAEVSEDKMTNFAIQDLMGTEDTERLATEGEQTVDSCDGCIPDELFTWPEEWQKDAVQPVEEVAPQESQQPVDELLAQGDAELFPEVEIHFCSTVGDGELKDFSLEGDEVEADDQTSQLRGLPVVGDWDGD